MRRQIFILLCIIQCGSNQECSNDDRLNGANIALRKRTAQSTTYTEQGVLYTSNRSVDGDIQTDWSRGSCSCTDTHQTEPAWWSVDLEEERILKKVKIFNRGDQSGRLKGAKVIGYSANGTVFEIGTSLPDMLIIELDIIPLNLIRNVTILLPANSVPNILNICEVQVFENLNIALGKSTQQSSDYRDGSKIYGAHLAVDGDESAVFSHGSCTATAPLTGANLLIAGNAFWSVDLGREYLISYIKVFNRKDDDKSDMTRRLGYFTVMASTETNQSVILYQEQSDDPGKEIGIPLYANITVPVKVISLSIPRPVNADDNTLKENVLTICEFEAYRAIACPIYRLENGNIQVHTMGDNKKNYTYCAALTLSCDLGYHFNSTEIQVLTTMCQSNGSWTTSAHCKDVDECKENDNMCNNNAQCVNVPGSFNCICREGYTGKTCDSVINCEEKVTNHIHGFLMFKEGISGIRSYNTTVSLICENGYMLNGPGLIRCNSLGHWEGNIGNCSVIHCEEQGTNPIHGSLMFEEGISGKMSYNTTVYMICDNGYMLDGSGLVRCNSSGQWEGNLGTCSVIHCEEQGTNPIHGSLMFEEGISGTMSYNTTVSMICDNGYMLDGSGLVRCNSSGQWEGNLGTCSVIHCEEQGTNPIHGSLMFEEGISGKMSYNTTVSMICENGYILNGPGLVRCNSSGQWEGNLGNCSVITCEEQGTNPIHGSLMFNEGISGNRSYNTTVSMRCENGYMLNGPGLLRCNRSGRWEGSLGYCSETLKNENPESNIAGVAGGVAAAICLVILGVIICFILYKRRRIPEHKIVDTSLGEIRSSTQRKEHTEGVVLEKSIYAQPMEINSPKEDPECEESKNVYMNSIDGSRDYYSFTQQKLTDKHSVRVEDLSSFFLSRKMEPNLYEEEYNNLPDGLTKSYEAALLPENRSKNRYKNIYPYDDTRVILEIWDPSNESDYINACYVNGFKIHTYIAAQGPTKDILNDFWRMIWQTKCSTIVMLTNLTEEGKHKCEQYWPDDGSMEYGDIIIRLVQCETFSDFTIRTLSIGKINGKAKGGKTETHQINQFHFTAWPDRGVPRFASSLVHFRQKIRASNNRQKAEGPMVVHCSAGIGRTGTFLAFDYLLDQAEELGFINVVKCVETLRKQRVNLVQTLEQFIFLHEALLEALTCTTMAVSTSDFQETYRKLLERDNKTGKRTLDDIFEKLPMYVSDPEEDVYENAKNMANRQKNRYSNILPDKNHCPFLNIYVKGRDSYINAVFLPAYKENNIFIITQTPLESTIVDFWRMVYQFEVGSIVMLNTLSEMKDEERYWTEDKKVLEIGPFRITLESKVCDDICTNYTMLLKYQEERRRVRLSRATYWADGKPVPMSPTAMLKQIDIIEKWQQESGSKPIIVHCMNGAEKSGLFCVIVALIDRTKIEQDVAVEQIIKQMRSRRPQIIPNVDQFKFCYDAMLTYLNQFDTYSNFTGL